MSYNCIYELVDNDNRENFCPDYLGLKTISIQIFQ